jgi:hypothetical protein
MLFSLVAIASAVAPPTYTPTDGVLNATAFEAFLVANAASADIVVLAPGVYHITALTAGAHLQLAQPLSNIVVDMSDVTLIMDKRSNTAVKISNWLNVTLQGLTIKYAVMPTNQAIIKSIADNGTMFDVEVPAGWPLDDWDNNKKFGCNVYLPGTRWLRVGAGDLGPLSIDSLAGARTYRMTWPRDVGPRTQSIAVGDVLGCRNAAFAFVFEVDGCTASTFRDITLKGGPGFGFFHHHPTGDHPERNMGGNTFERLWLTYPDPPAGSASASSDSVILSSAGAHTTMMGPGLPLTWPVLSSSADAFHLSGVPIGPTIKSCVLEGHNDDGIALHGSYSVVVDADLTVDAAGAFRLWVTSADYQPGNVIKIYDTRFLLADTLRVTGVAAPTPNGKYAPPHNASHTMPGKALLPEPHTWYQVLNVTTTNGSAPPSGIGFDYVAFNTDRSCSSFALINNTIRNHRARGMLVKASNGLIRGNHIENSTLGGIVITPELYWGEGDFVSNVTVENNTVRSVCIGKQCYGGLALGAMDPSKAFAGGPPYGHSDIRIVGNRFENISQMSLWVSSTKGVRVVNNTFESPYAYTPVADCCPPYPIPKVWPNTDRMIAWMTETSSANVSGNCVQHPASAVWSGINTTATVLDSTIDARGAFSAC